MLRALPSVDVLIGSLVGAQALRGIPRPRLAAAVRDVLAAERRRLLDAGGAAADGDTLGHQVVAQLTAGGLFSLARVINATGVVLHTNLGRALLSPLAQERLREVAAAYSNLEMDLSRKERGSRYAHVDGLLRRLSGGEAALVVNNCASAVLLALESLARGKEVIVSRGELIEIGGEFRIPDIMRASGAKLVEVGTTNRTRLADYRAALDDRTAAILKVHPSNYRVVGFTAEVAANDLAALAAGRSIPFVYDVGSGLLDRERGFPLDEPTVRGALEDGADLVTFSADKLLGGPQAGCITGAADLIRVLREHPLARAVRVDKLQISALEATLRLYATGAHGEIPVHAMVHADADRLVKRAQILCEAIGGDLEGAHVVRCSSVVGGGSMPGSSLASWGVRVRPPDPSAFAARLRSGSPPVFCRIDDDDVVLDVRTVPEAQIPDLARAVQYALEGDDVDED